MTTLSAALGPTNTGKTWLAVTRMLARSSGCIGLPLRLLAREVYERIVAEKGTKYAALVTGEEKIIPKTARWFACTVESMPPHQNGRPFAFVGIDEVQLADDPERGHVFTDRILHMRGSEETMLMGASRMQNLLRSQGVQNTMEVRQRFSPLSHIGHIKLSSLPKRTAIVAFSADQVYGLAEMLRRTRGGAAIVMGNLSPQTRNEQVALYQSGEVDFLVATDAIGLGLNMDITHVALAQTTKFDGRLRREIFTHELAQIVGRAGRGTRPGSFGTTGQAPPFDESVVQQIENNQFHQISKIYWRNSSLCFDSIAELNASLAIKPDRKYLRRIRTRIDEQVWAELSSSDLLDRQTDQVLIRRLWEICQLPDFRKLGFDPHLALLGELAGQLLTGSNRLCQQWFSLQLQQLDKVSGTIDMLSGRLAYIRTWSYCANRADWLEDPEHWRGICGKLESKLSNALHEKLVEQFVDRRTSVLFRFTRSNAITGAHFAKDGAVEVEGHLVGHLRGFVFRPISRSKSNADKASRQAANKVIRPEIKKQMHKLIDSKDETFSLNDDGQIVWAGNPVAQLVAGASTLQPVIEILGETEGQPVEPVQARLLAWLRSEIELRLPALLLLQEKIDAGTLDPAVRGLGFRLGEALGAIDRRKIASELRNISQEQRACLRDCGVRFGEFSLFMPALLRPAPSRLLALLLAFGPKGNKQPWFAPAGLTSLAAETAIAPEALSAVGLRKCGNRLIRLDMLERVGAEIRSAREKGKSGCFQPTLEMVALLGCTKLELAKILESIGYSRIKSVKDETGTIDELASIWSQRSPKSSISESRKATSKKTKTTSANRKKPAEQKKVDPDSPFAVLHALKLGND